MTDAPRPSSAEETFLARRRDPDYMPPLSIAAPLGVQHILAMFVSNVAPAIIVAGAAGLGTDDLVYMIQAAMVFSGITTLFQTVGLGPMGARLPVVQGTSFAFLPVAIPLVAGQGADAMAGLMTGALAAGLFQICLSLVVTRVRFMLPPLVTGLVVLMIGLSLIPVGVQYAAGGVEAMGSPAFGSAVSWMLAGVVVLVTLGLKFFARGAVAIASVLAGLIAGYLVALALGRVDMSAIGAAPWFMLPRPFHFGLSFSGAAVIGFILMMIVTAIETVGDVTAIAKSGAGRDATDRELRGAVLADGVGTALAAAFGALPNTSFGQNVGLVAMTGVMSRHVVTLGAVFLVACGLAPKIGALITTIPIEVLGGAVIIMFGMVAGAGLSILSEVRWTQRSMLIFAASISIGLGLQLVPTAVQHLPPTLHMLATSGVLPAAFVAVLMNLLLPQIKDDQAGH